MKIVSVMANNHKKAFEVQSEDLQYPLPYSRLDPQPSTRDPVVSTFIDEELNSQGFVYRLASGAEGTVLWDMVLDYNSDPEYVRRMLVHKFTIEARKRLKDCSLSRRAISRRLGTSPSQFYRLIDPGNQSKSVDSMLALLHALDCQVDIVVKAPK